MFAAAHTDGTIIVYDTEREDAAFTPEAPYKRTAPHVPVSSGTGPDSGSGSGAGLGPDSNPNPTSIPASGSAPQVGQSGSSSSSIPSEDSSSAKEPWDPLESIFVSRTPTPAPGHAYARGGKPERERTHKNPVSHWRVAKRSILGECPSLLFFFSTFLHVYTSEELMIIIYADMAYSSDARYLAAVSEDGCLRIIDAVQET